MSAAGATEGFTKTLGRDAIAGVVVFLVALPLCLGVAQASGAEPIAGMIAGIVGGIVVGLLSGSHTSVSGPAAGLTAVVASQIASLGSYEAFLLAVVIAGVIQMALGIARAGVIAVYFPMSVIRGLLTAIGVILILKQFPHLVGLHADPEGDMAFVQPDGQNTFTEMLAAVTRFHPGATSIGLISVAVLLGLGQHQAAQTLDRARAVHRGSVGRRAQRVASCVSLRPAYRLARSAAAILCRCPSPKRWRASPTFFASPIFRGSPIPRS